MNMKKNNSILALPIISILVTIIAAFSICASAAEYTKSEMTAHSISPGSTVTYWHGGKDYYPARPSSQTGGSYSVKMTYAESSPWEIGHKNYTTGAKTLSRVDISKEASTTYYPSPTFKYRVYCSNGWVSKTIYVKSGSISATIW